MRYPIALVTSVLAILLPVSLLAAPSEPQRGLQPSDMPASAGDDDSSDDEGSDDETTDEPRPFAHHFVTDPRLDPESVVTGEPLARLAWNADSPAYPGDLPGSLDATYDAHAAAGLFGFPLPQEYNQDDTFTAAAAFVIHSDGFQADPDGFFQLSWGLWNRSTTGLNRTGDPESFAGDTFELLEFDYFPNVSTYFGGPFAAASIFGVAAVNDPSFEFSGSFVNFASLFDLQVDLPLDLPLFAVLEHRPELDSLTVQVFRIVSSDGVLALQGAVGPVALDLLPLREYDLDLVGLTLWTDGFSGPSPSVLATLTYHALIVVPGLSRPEELLRTGLD